MKGVINMKKPEYKKTKKMVACYYAGSAPAIAAYLASLCASCGNSAAAAFAGI
jgi:hypothetical protein